MIDLISRQAAIEATKRLLDYYGTNEITKEFADDAAEDFINKIPAVEERETGKWIKHEEIKNVYGGKCIECSECGEKYIVQYIEDEKYCRNCGADMR